MNKANLTVGSLCVLAALLTGCGLETGSRGASGLISAQSAAKAQVAASSWIGPDGGVLTDGISTLTVPAGAMSTSTWISLNTTQSNGSQVCQIAPSGITFSGGATLSLPLPAGWAGGSPHLVGFEPGDSIGVDLGGVVGGGRIQTVVDGSRYVIEVVN